MYYCIVNPSARSGHGESLWSGLENRFKEKNILYKVVFTAGPGHALRVTKKLTSNFSDKDELPIKLVVMGGDGTLNEVVSGIQDFSKVLLGYVPVGSSNDFARDMDLPTPEELFDHILDGKVLRKLDVGKLTYGNMTKALSRLHDTEISNTRTFAVSSGIGFDAAVCEEALASKTKNILNKIGLGKLTYVSIALRQIFTADKIPCEITVDDKEPIKLKHFLFIATMVHHFEGGGFMFAPDADLTDGLFDIMIVGELSPLRICVALPLAVKGKHYGIKGIDLIKAKKITITTPIPMWVHTDGEVQVKSDSISLECMQQKLQIMI
ncbi:MAG: diacylglycerol kinase family lipid kinase [Butyrivibrio sp.]|nr:diacylglycerol kinase family lipid kinase [Butyrivibrio sp.]